MDMSSISRDLSVIFMKIALGGTFLTWDMWGYLWGFIFVIAFYQLMLKHKGDMKSGLNDALKLVAYAGLSHLLLGGPMYKEFGQNLFTAQNAVKPATQCMDPNFSGGQVSYEAQPVSPRKKSDYFHSQGKSLLIDAMAWGSYTADTFSDAAFCSGVGARMVNNLGELWNTTGDGLLGLFLCSQFQPPSEKDLSLSFNPSSITPAPNTSAATNSNQVRNYLNECIAIAHDPDLTIQAKSQKINELSESNPSEEKGLLGNVPSMGDMFSAAIEKLFGPALLLLAIVGGALYYGPLLGSALLMGGFIFLVVFVLSIIFNFIMSAVFAATMALSIIGFVMVSPFMMLEKYREKVISAAMIPLSTCLYGFASNFISFVGNLFILGAIYMVNASGHSGAGTNGFVNNSAAMIIWIMASLFIMIIVLALQSWAITKVPKLALGLVRIDLDSITSIGQEVMSTLKTVGGAGMMVGSAAITGGVGLAMGSKLASGMGAMRGAISGAGSLVSRIPFVQNLAGGIRRGLSGITGQSSQRSAFSPSSRYTSRGGGNEGGGTGDSGPMSAGGSFLTSENIKLKNESKAPASAFSVGNSTAHKAETKYVDHSPVSTRKPSIKVNDPVISSQMDGVRRGHSDKISSSPQAMNNFKVGESSNEESTQGSSPKASTRDGISYEDAVKIRDRDEVDRLFDAKDKDGDGILTMEEYKEVDDMMKELEKMKRNRKVEAFKNVAGFLSSAFDAGISASSGQNFSMDFGKVIDESRARADHKKALATGQQNIEKKKQALIDNKIKETQKVKAEEEAKALAKVKAEEEAKASAEAEAKKIAKREKAKATRLANKLKKEQEELRRQAENVSYNEDSPRPIEKDKKP